MNNSVEFYPRDFKGVWIPSEIWLNDDLTLYDKAIFTEIDSLDRHLSGGDYCYASNEYLAKFCKCSPRKVTESISRLIKMGLLKVVKTDGRRRWIKSLLKERLADFAMQNSEKCEAEENNLLQSNIDDKYPYKYKYKDNKESNSKRVCSIVTPIEKKAGKWEWESDKQYVDYIEKVLPKMIKEIASEYGKKSDIAYNVFLTITSYYFEQYRAFNGSYHPWYREDTLRECFSALFEFFNDHLNIDDVKDYINQFFTHKTLRKKPFKVFSSYNMLETLQHELDQDWNDQYFI